MLVTLFKKPSKTQKMVCFKDANCPQELISRAQDGNWPGMSVTLGRSRAAPW